jgi:hypothetical protein
LEDDNEEQQDKQGGVEDVRASLTKRQRRILRRRNRICERRRRESETIARGIRMIMETRSGRTIGAIDRAGRKGEGRKGEGTGCFRKSR